MLYSDSSIDCDESGITIRGYYFPWGMKRIAYDDIREAVIVPIGVAAGRGRLWGTANPGLWANLDLQRPSKSEALILDLGRRVRPFLTPDDVDAVALVIHNRTGLRILRDDRGRLI